MKTRTSQSSFYTERMSVATRCLKMGYSDVFTKENTEVLMLWGYWREKFQVQGLQETAVY